MGAGVVTVVVRWGGVGRGAAVASATGTAAVAVGVVGVAAPGPRFPGSAVLSGGSPGLDHLGTPQGLRPPRLSGWSSR
ncbi:MAG: hypothetical protein M3404_06890 [Actinomycetota bacterium]|nr:hypothetical protein [Actinomycetota bacterium]